MVRITHKRLCLGQPLKEFDLKLKFGEKMKERSVSIFSNLFLALSTIFFVGICSFIIFTDAPECRIDEAEKPQELGIVVSVTEIPTSFNDFRRMQLDVEDETELNYDGKAGTYFIKGVTNVRLHDKVSLVKTNCGTRIKLGSFNKTFSTFEPK